PLVPFVVQRLAGVDDAGLALDPGDDLLRPGHLRHTLRVDEADGFDPRDTGGREAVDELRTDRGLEMRRLVLQPVARADVADRDPHRTPSSFICVISPS